MVPVGDAERRGPLATALHRLAHGLERDTQDL